MNPEWKQNMAMAGLDAVLAQALDNPEKNLPALLGAIERLDGGKRYRPLWSRLRHALKTPDNPTRRMALDALMDIDARCLRLFLDNVVVRGALFDPVQQHGLEKKLHCRLPRIIALTPTSQCNLPCLDCPSPRATPANLSHELMERVIGEGKNLGVHLYLFCGGEPLIRRDAVLRLCRAHQDCFFAAFTNGTLVDQAFAHAARQAGNLLLVFSMEGFEPETDRRRGRGAYRRAVRGMELLNTARVPFGAFVPCRDANVENAASEDFLDSLIARGSRFVCYAPATGPAFSGTRSASDKNDADQPTDEADNPMPDPKKEPNGGKSLNARQHAHIRRQAARFRAGKAIVAFTLDSLLCQEGGLSHAFESLQTPEGNHAGPYLKINANGDVQGCGFRPRTDGNVNAMPLLNIVLARAGTAHIHEAPTHTAYNAPDPEKTKIPS